MRPTDVARLSEPYPEHVEPTDEDARAALGLKLPRWAALESDVFSDFTEQPPYGIRWWAPHPGTSRRILIGDQLYGCLASVAGNMTEGALHWLEYLDASDRDSARFADAVKMHPADQRYPHRRHAVPTTNSAQISCASIRRASSARSHRRSIASRALSSA